MTIKLHSIEKLLSVLFVFFLSGALTPLMRTYYVQDSSLMEGDPFMQVQWLSIYFITFLFIIRHGLKKYLSILIKERWILLILLFIGISFLWADFTGTSIRRSVALMGTSLFGLYLACRFTVRESLLIILQGLGIALILSILAGIFIPDVGLMRGIHDGALQGVFIHKNIIGRFSVLFSIIGMICYIGNYINKKNYYLTLILSFIIIVWSNSFTALVLFVLINAVFFLKDARMKLYANKVVVGYTVLIIFVPLIIFLISNSSEILDYFGRDLTFTGRTVYWAGMLYMFLQRPLFGYGYGSFWVGEQGPSGELYKIIPWEPMHAHNGYIDLLLGGGVILLVLFLVSLVSNYIRTKNIKNRSHIYYLGILFSAFYIIYNFSESLIAIQNNLFWVIYVYMSLVLFKNKKI